MTWRHAVLQAAGKRMRATRVSVRLLRHMEHLHLKTVSLMLHLESTHYSSMALIKHLADTGVAACQDLAKGITLKAVLRC